MRSPRRAATNPTASATARPRPFRHPVAEVAGQTGTDGDHERRERHPESGDGGDDSERGEAALSGDDTGPIAPSRSAAGSSTAQPRVAPPTRAATTSGTETHGVAPGDRDDRGNGGCRQRRWPRRRRGGPPSPWARRRRRRPGTRARRSGRAILVGPRSARFAWPGDDLVEGPDRVEAEGGEQLVGARPAGRSNGPSRRRRPGRRRPREGRAPARAAARSCPTTPPPGVQTSQPPATPVEGVGDSGVGGWCRRRRRGRGPAWRARVRPPLGPSPRPRSAAGHRPARPAARRPVGEIGSGSRRAPPRTRVAPLRPAARGRPP